MTFYSLLIWQLVAHFLADFGFQSEKMCKLKLQRNFGAKALYVHVGIVFLFSWVFSFSYIFGFYALGIAVVHGVADGGKAWIEKQYRVLHLQAFVVDQLFHLLCISIIVFLAVKNGVVSKLPYREGVILLGYILCTKPTNIALKKVMEAFGVESQPGCRELLNAGKLIGICERILVFTFVLVNQYSAIGFLIAAKSIIRYKDKEKPKTEYVLIGTLFSFAVAVLVGVGVNVLIK